MSFYLPQTFGEWLAWLGALIFLIRGLIFFFYPQILEHFLMQSSQMKGGPMRGELRASIGGGQLGLGLAYLVFSQPFIALALGGASAFSVLGRLLSFVFDKAISWTNICVLLVDLIISFVTLSYALGLIN